MKIRATGGLCNRLRVVLSYRAAFPGCTIVWQPDGEIAGARFSDVFDALDGVTFADTAYASSTCDPYPDAPPGWTNTYRELRLLPEHLDRLHDRRPCDAYSAIHVRRTDHDAIAASDPTRDQEFEAFVRYARDVVYIATDNGDTQSEMARMITACGRTPAIESIIAIHAKQNESGQRNTPLSSAAIDLFICAGTDSFKGTRHSSFSNAVDLLRAIGGWWSR